MRAPNAAVGVAPASSSASRAIALSSRSSRPRALRARVVASPRSSRGFAKKKKPSEEARPRIVTRASASAANVALVGLGTRGGVVVDALALGGPLERAEYWALNSDPVSLQASACANRWRLPPSNVDVSGRAARDNAEAAAREILAGGSGRVPPDVIVVVASANEASGAGLQTIVALAELKERGFRKQFGFKVGFNGLAGPAAMTHAGPLLVLAVTCPFDFEGPRKSAAAADFLEKAQREADLLVVVPQQSLTTFRRVLLPRRSPYDRVVVVNADP